jgi:hypothetical protein
LVERIQGRIRFQVWPQCVEHLLSLRSESRPRDQEAQECEHLPTDFRAIDPSIANLELHVTEIPYAHSRREAAGETAAKAGNTSLVPCEGSKGRNVVGGTDLVQQMTGR